MRIQETRRIVVIDELIKTDLDLYKSLQLHECCYNPAFVRSSMLGIKPKKLVVKFRDTIRVLTSP